MGTQLELYRSFDPPYERFERGLLGPDFAAELDLVSRLWFRCGYRPGIGAYLNFFLLKDLSARTTETFRRAFARCARWRTRSTRRTSSSAR